MLRLGIDVGGTNTDAVLMRDSRVVDWVKTATTRDVTQGITQALRQLLDKTGVDTSAIDGVMIGTTHFTNAVVERRGLMPTAAIRLGLPATRCLPPMVDWPEDLRAAVGNHYYLVHGGHEYDGRLIADLDADELRAAAGDIAERGIRSIAISAVFSPINAEVEREAGEIVRSQVPAASITLSHEIGRLGLLERESAAIMNACLQDLGAQTVAAFRRALSELQITAPLFLTQNDGTLMSADYAGTYPVFTFASGPTNSMRGAAFLSGLGEAIVVDIGGTTTDVGALVRGFPREASVAAKIGGVRTNFRMPDVYSLGLGGGSRVSCAPLAIGPQSVGYELATRAVVFGGDVLTASDIAVAAGLADLGDRARVAHLERTLVHDGVELMQEMVETAVDRMRTSAQPVPVVVVGGGSILVSQAIKGAAEMIMPPHYQVANAVGSAIAQISGDVDRIFALAEIPRARAMDTARAEAIAKAAAAGADPATIQIVDVEDIPLSYLPGNATRMRVKAVGDLAMGRRSEDGPCG